MARDGSDLRHPSNRVLSVITGIIGGIGVPGNLFLMFLIVSEYKKRKPHDWLLFLLALGDFLLCLNNVALEAPFILNFHHVACKIGGFMEYTLGTFSFLTPPLVAYNRYLSLYDNQRYQKLFTNRNVIIAWSSIGLFSICWMSPYVVTGQLGQDGLGLCGTQLTSDFLAGLYIAAVITVDIGYGILLYYSYKVVVKIKNHRKAAVGESRFQSRLINESQDIIKAILLVSAVPLVSQIPAVLIKVLQIFLPPFNPWVGRLATSLFPLTSAANPFITAYVIREYRKKVLNIFNVKPMTVNPEGQIVPRGWKTGESVGRLSMKRSGAETNQ